MIKVQSKVIRSGRVVAMAISLQCVTLAVILQGKTLIYTSLNVQKLQYGAIVIKNTLKNEHNSSVV